MTTLVPARRVVVLLIGVAMAIGLLVLTPGEAEACTCAVVSDETRYEQAEAIYKAVPVERYEEDNAVFYDAVVTEVWKGEVNPRVVLHAGPYGSSCGPPAELTIGVARFVTGDSERAGVQGACGWLTETEAAELTQSVRQPQIDDRTPRFVALPARPGVRVAMLNGAGEVIAQARGGGYPREAAVCSDTGRLVELAASAPHRHIDTLVVRDLATLDAIATVDLSESIRESSFGSGLVCLADGDAGPTVAFMSATSGRKGKHGFVVIRDPESETKLDLGGARMMVWAESQDLLWLYQGPEVGSVSAISVDTRDVVLTVPISGVNGVMTLDPTTGDAVVITRTTSQSADGFLTRVSADGSVSELPIQGFRRLFGVDIHNGVIRLGAFHFGNTVLQMRSMTGELLASEPVSSSTMFRSGEDVFARTEGNGVDLVARGDEFIERRVNVPTSIDQVVGVLPPGLADVRSSSLPALFERGGTILGEPIDPVEELARRRGASGAAQESEDGNEPEALGETVGEESGTNPLVALVVLVGVISVGAIWWRIRGSGSTHE